MLIVQKYGGSSVANTERVLNVARRVIETYKKGNDVVVVLSAQGDTTDDLIAKANEITSKPSRREMDMLLCTGEQQSVALMAIAIKSLGCPAISLNSVQTGIVSTSTYGNARIKVIKTERIVNELENRRIVIVTGFQGINKHEDMTTLGRGGSDTTAVALAAALNADLCEIYTDVDGIYTADPRIVKDARKLDEISYDEMLELASLGAKVLHNRSVELAKKYNVKLVVRSSLNNNEGTIVKEESKVEKMLVSGVASDADISRVSIIGVDDVLGKAFSIFSLLAKEKISVDIILQSVGIVPGKKNISFTVNNDDLERCLNVLEGNKEVLGVEKILHDGNVAKVSIVGAGMATNPGAASLMFEALYDANVNIDLISTSEIKISVLVDKRDVDIAVRSIHEKFNLASFSLKQY